MSDNFEIQYVVQVLRHIRACCIPTKSYISFLWRNWKRNWKCGYFYM